VSLGERLGLLAHVWLGMQDDFVAFHHFRDWREAARGAVLCRFFRVRVVHGLWENDA
jgi:hypothetical protein